MHSKSSTLVVVYATCSSRGYSEGSMTYLRHPADMAHERAEQTHGGATALLGITGVVETSSHSHESP